MINTLNHKVDLEITLYRIGEPKKTGGKICHNIGKFLQYNDFLEIKRRVKTYQLLKALRK